VSSLQIGALSVVGALGLLVLAVIFGLISRETLVSLFVGSAVTWAVAAWYYQHAAKDLEQASERLREETAHVRKLVNILAQALKNEGVVDVTWDAAGNLAGVVLRLQSIPSGEAFGTPSIILGPPPEAAQPPEHPPSQGPTRNRRRRRAR
jgi:hypothetical protein